MNHTPGPWSQFVWDKRKPHLRTIGARNKPGGPDHILTAEISESDANLIAAAPDLLEAAKHAVMEWRLHGALTDSCRVLETAIAKAERRP